MNNVIEVNASQFVEPTYIEELGDYGLTVQEIADSLGIEAGNVRKKIRNDNLIEYFQSVNLPCVVNLNFKNINGVQYTEYILGIQAAKFFVASYRNDIGRAYLLHLILLEENHHRELRGIEAKVKSISDSREYYKRKASDKGHTVRREYTVGVPVMRDTYGIFADGSSEVTVVRKKRKDLTPEEEFDYKCVRLIKRAHKALTEFCKMNLRLWANDPELTAAVETTEHYVEYVKKHMTERKELKPNTLSFEDVH